MPNRMAFRVEPPCAAAVKDGGWCHPQDLPLKQATETAGSLNSALCPQESGFAKICQSRASMFVNKDHSKTTILEQNRIRNYPNRVYPISDGFEQSLLLGLQDDLEHCAVIVDK